MPFMLIVNATFLAVVVTFLKLTNLSKSTKSILIKFCPFLLLIPTIEFYQCPALSTLTFFVA